MIVAMSDTVMQAGMLAGMVLGGGGFCLGVWAAVQVSGMKERVDVLDDAATPSPLSELAEAVTDPTGWPAVKPSPRPRTDTEESDMPRQIEEAKLQAERSTGGRHHKKEDTDA